MNTLMKGVFAAICALALVAVFSDVSSADRLVKVEMFAPENGHQVGINGAGWFVDLEIEFKVPLAQSGFTVNADNQPGFQLTGPNAGATANYAASVHNNARPFPGTFSLGRDERIPGLIVILSTTIPGAGSCQNIANLFNLTGVTDLEPTRTEIWDTWIVGAQNFGVNTMSTIHVAVADDINGDGIFNDAPNVLPDADGNGICDDKDLKAFGIASNIEKARFFINGPIDLTGVPTLP